MVEHTNIPFEFELQFKITFFIDLCTLLCLWKTKPNKNFMAVFYWLPGTSRTAIERLRTLSRTAIEWLRALSRTAIERLRTLSRTAIEWVIIPSVTADTVLKCVERDVRPNTKKVTRAHVHLTVQKIICRNPISIEQTGTRDVFFKTSTWCLSKKLI